MAHIQNNIAMKQAKHAKLLFLAAALCSLSCFIYVNVDAATQPKQTLIEQEMPVQRNVEAEKERKDAKIQLPVITLVGRIVEVAGDVFRLLH